MQYFISFYYKQYLSYLQAIAFPKEQFSSLNAKSSDNIKVDFYTMYKSQELHLQLRGLCQI